MGVKRFVRFAPLAEFNIDPSLKAVFVEVAARTVEYPVSGFSCSLVVRAHGDARQCSPPARAPAMQPLSLSSHLTWKSRDTATEILGCHRVIAPHPKAEFGM